MKFKIQSFLWVNEKVTEGPIPSLLLYAANISSAGCADIIRIYEVVIPVGN